MRYVYGKVPEWSEKAETSFGRNKAKPVGPSDFVFFFLQRTMCGGFWTIHFQTLEHCEEAGLFFEDYGFKWTYDWTDDPSPASRKYHLNLFATCASYELKERPSNSLCTIFTPFFLKMTNFYVHHLAIQAGVLADDVNVKYWESPCYNPDGADPECKTLHM